MLLYIHRRYPIDYFDITVILMLWLLCLKTQSNNLQGNRALIGTEVLGEPPRRIAFPTNCTWIHTYSISLHTVYIYVCIYIYINFYTFSYSLRYTAFYLDNHGYTNMSMDTSDVLYHFLSAAFMNTHSMNDRMCICIYVYTLVCV